MELRSKFYKYTGKRIFDIFSSVIILLVLLPIIIIIAILIKFDSEGPIFFFQERVGYKNKSFIIWKFRTMIVDSSKYSLSPDSTDDPRITKMGRHLRKTGLDEIPQLFNVLMGKMSLVGPRPEMPFLVNEYSDRERCRHLVRPGITGPWQISEYRKKSIQEGIELDLAYIKNMSFSGDIVFLVKTAKTFLGKNTF